MIERTIITTQRYVRNLALVILSIMCTHNLHSLCIYTQTTHTNTYA